ncbi:hypothetical protein [Effusibacillus dendaii]|uniref:Uncharacterized protein n=1 Tax=Effusibacillus dendaii TaxID=2743772 RepID=A0A7I8D4Q8_9BACL|nr:hypothetical protein [Effusibacillus dendaii]BCJ85108.1 hypothetical protein skT53_00930 [Effusibacillus dendaii]
MSITENDWREEQQRVDMVTEKIGKRIERLEEEVGTVKVDVVNIRRHFWDDVTVNLSNPDEVTETYFSMKQQVEVRSERERRHRQSAAELNKLSR